MSEGRRGLSFVEVLVCGAILVASAGVVVPILTMRDFDRTRSHVERDIAALAGGIERFIADTKTFPTGAGGSTSLHFLFSQGVRPANNLFASGPGMPVADFLLEGKIGGKDWKGPYLPHEIGPDPWGHAYVINVNGFFSSGERAMIVCAGPNGQVNTAPSATTAGGDDYMTLIE